MMTTGPVANLWEQYVEQNALDDQQDLADVQAHFYGGADAMFTLMAMAFEELGDDAAGLASALAEIKAEVLAFYDDQAPREGAS